MTDMANVQPTSQNSGLPAPSGAPAAAPAGDTPTTPPEQTAALPTSPVNAQSATSDAVQRDIAAQQAAQAQEAQAPAPVHVEVTGNKVFDDAAGLMAGKVDNVNDILKEAASGEVSLATQADLVSKLGAEVASLVINSMKTEVDAIRTKGEAQSTAIKNKLAESLGAPAEQANDVWEQVAAYARSAESGLSEADVKGLNDLLKQGGVAADLAVGKLSELYQKSQGFNLMPNLIQGQGGMQGSFEPLTKQQYSAQMREAVATHGEGSREVEALRNRRTLSIQRGF